jgi:hypothetical protein
MFDDPVREPNEIAYQWGEFESLPGHVALPILFWLLLERSPLEAWAVAIAVGGIVGVVRWFVYPGSVWANPIFSVVRTVLLWGGAAYVAWVLWGKGLHAQAVLLLVARFALSVVVLNALAEPFGAVFAMRAGAVVPKRLFFRQWLGVDDLGGEIVQPARPLLNAFAFVLLFRGGMAAAWMGLVWAAS